MCILYFSEIYDHKYFFPKDDQVFWVVVPNFANPRYCKKAMYEKNPFLLSVGLSFLNKAFGLILIFVLLGKDFDSCFHGLSAFICVVGSSILLVVFDSEVSYMTHSFAWNYKHFTMRWRLLSDLISHTSHYEAKSVNICIFFETFN